MVEALAPVVLAAGGVWIIASALVAAWRHWMAHSGRWASATATIEGPRGRARRTGRLHLWVEVPVGGDVIRARLTAPRYHVGEAYRAEHPTDQAPAAGAATRLPPLDRQLAGFEVPVAVSPRPHLFGRHHVQYRDPQGPTSAVVGIVLSLVIGIALAVWTLPDALDVLGI
ncbi:MAG: hypothetical protein AB1Z55_12115 [Acidimicrobiia bacterium]